jgi:exonuclease III
MERNGAWAVGLQETWRTGDTIEEHRDYTILNHGPHQKLCNRGSLGVAIALSRDARQAWEKAGSQVLYYGLRIIATRLEMQDTHGKTFNIFLASAYAPAGEASGAERGQFAADLQRCFDACGKREVLVMCADTNASCGIRSKHDDPNEAGRDQVRGPHGAPYQNNAGRELVSQLARNQLCLPTTYFKKRNYHTWHHPASKLGHQIDHFILRQGDLKRVRSAGYDGRLGQQSDHAPVRIKLALCRQLKVRRPDRPKTRIDRSLLKIPEKRAAFCQAMKAKYAVPADKPGEPSTRMTRVVSALQAAAKETLTTSVRQQPGWYEAAKESIEPAVLERNKAQRVYTRDPTPINHKSLSIKRNECKAIIREADQAWLADVVASINTFNEGGMPQTATQAWAGIKKIRQGKSVTRRLAPMTLQKANGELCKNPGENAAIMKEELKRVFSVRGAFDPAAIDKVPQRDKNKFRCLDNCPEDEEMSTHLHKLGNDKSGADAKCPVEYYKALHTDPEARKFLFDALKHYWTSGSWNGAYTPIYEKSTPTQLPTTDKEIIAYMQTHSWRISWAPNPHRPGTAIGAKYDEIAIATTIAQARQLGATPHKLAKWLTEKQLLPHDPADEPDLTDNLPLLDDTNGVVYPEWEVARLNLLPKKGDLSLCKNWRGICLLDIASKILSSIMVGRMQLVQKEFGLEMQNGFKNGCGTIDGLFNTSIGLQKRKEHGLDTWVLFIDLMKAFDTVPRELLFQILRKFGMPDHFVNLVIRLHTNCKIKFKVGDVDSEVDSDIGVRQGSCEGPVLFLFIIQAALEALDWTVPKPKFCTRVGEKGKISGDSGGKHKRTITAFELWASLFADDCGLLFETRADLIAGANCLYQGFLQFGLHMHIGRDTTKSKTEAMYCPAQSSKYEENDTSDFVVADGYIHFCEDFKYLGAIISNTLTSDADVEKRIAAAGAAFGALRTCIFTKKGISRRVMGMIYSSLVLSVLLYGSECWCMTKTLLRHLRSFHHRCARTMCQITMHHTIKHHIKSKDLLQQLGIQSIEHYYNSRLLRWAGHVARMDSSRTPRKLLTGFLEQKRPTGRPTKTWGHALADSLKLYEIDYKTWIKTAQDRSHWRHLTSKLFIKHPSFKLAPIDQNSFSFRPLTGEVSNLSTDPWGPSPLTTAQTTASEQARQFRNAASNAARIAAVYEQLQPPHQGPPTRNGPISDWEHEHKHDDCDKVA